MWRKLLARTHPDGGGSHELFIWAKHLHDVVCGGVRDYPPTPPRPQAKGEGPRSTPKEEQPRVPFDEESFEDLTAMAIALAATVNAPYDRLLGFLEDIEEEDESSPLHTQQKQGATYRTLAAIGHAAGLDGAQRTRWYKLAETVPLSQRHAGHILTKLKGGT